MSFAQYLYQLVDIIGNHAVKEHYTDNGADCEELEEIMKCAKDLSKYSYDYVAVYEYAEKVQEYIEKKMKARKEISRYEHDNNE